MSTDFKSILRNLRKKPGNSQCSDCLAKAPSWCSYSHGVFLCLACAGVHRGLGPNNSRVRSSTLDDWDLESVRNMSRNGNIIVNSKFEALLPPNFQRPKNQEDMAKFIYDKYVTRKWYSDDVNLQNQRMEQNAEMEVSTKPRVQDSSLLSPQPKKGPGLFESFRSASTSSTRSAPSPKPVSSQYATTDPPVQTAAPVHRPVVVEKPKPKPKSNGLMDLLNFEPTKPKPVTNNTPQQPPKQQNARERDLLDALSVPKKSHPTRSPSPAAQSLRNDLLMSLSKPSSKKAPQKAEEDVDLSFIPVHMLPK
ncbi:hypothetical protein PCE1_000183 [Barthelona sp. PCE]